MSVQVTQKSGEGLSRVFGVVVSKDDLNGQLEAKIAEMRPNMNLKGFRPGKVPALHVKKMYGKAIMQEIVDKAVSDASSEALSQAGARPAAQPDIKLSSDLGQVMDGKADLAFDLDVELMPEFEPADLSGVAFERPTYAATDEEIDAQITEIAGANRTFEAKKGKAVDGDMIVADFIGRIDGEAFEGGAAEDAEIVIGSNRFIPGFEEQLAGAKAGETRTITVTFPEGYQAAQLAGKPAEFEVTVKEVRGPKTDETVDDAFAERLGLPSLQALKDAIRGQLEGQYAGASRQKLKRALLDALDERHSFPLPPRMVEQEFGSIWSQVEQERASGQASEDDAGKSDEELRVEYRRIAERRVRLGLVLAEIGRRAGVDVSDQEMQRALISEVQKYPQEQWDAVAKFFRENPQAQASLRAPVYEEKVVDLLIGRAAVTDRAVSKEELFAEDELPAAYAEGDDAKPAKKAKSKAASKADEAAPEGESEAKAAPAKKKAAPKKKATEEG